MMNNHLLLMVLFSALVSLVFTYLTKNGSRERGKYFLYLFGSFVLISVVVGWLMYPFPF
jgi:cytochrome bd-type quinol oxidase subunit 2